jgi:transposase
VLGKEREQKDFFDEHVYGRLVPEDHLLVRLAREVDFSFVEEETRDLYSESMGRTSFPPVVLFKVLLLEYFYGLSDPRVVQECQWNLLFRRFLGLGIDEPTPGRYDSCGVQEATGRGEIWEAF